MTELTRNQQKRLQTDRVLALDVADIATALADGTLASAHHAAASNTTGPTPSSRWPDNDTRTSIGSHSDPTASAALSDEAITDKLADLRRTLEAWRATGYELVQLCNDVISRTLDTDPDRDSDPKLDEQNRGEGTCAVCGHACPGTDRDRLRPIRKETGYVEELLACPPCEQSWRRYKASHLDADVYHWCQERRRHADKGYTDEVA